jgi:hypothetical protein
MRLQPEETELVGKWFVLNGQVRGDATYERVQWLAANHLRRLAISKEYGAWETLFQDPDDGRYWEQTYPEGYTHGGGPPALRCLSREEAKAKYGDEKSWGSEISSVGEVRSTYEPPDFAKRRE